MKIVSYDKTDIKSNNPHLAGGEKHHYVEKWSLQDAGNILYPKGPLHIYIYI